jgi:hypothetical protein
LSNTPVCHTPVAHDPASSTCTQFSKPSTFGKGVYNCNGMPVECLQFLLVSESQQAKPAAMHGSSAVTSGFSPNRFGHIWVQPRMVQPYTGVQLIAGRHVCVKQT